MHCAESTVTFSSPPDTNFAKTITEEIISRPAWCCNILWTGGQPPNNFANDNPKLLIVEI
jgi:hypothetical protein